MGKIITTNKDIHAEIEELRAALTDIFVEIKNEHQELMKMVSSDYKDIAKAVKTLEAKTNTLDGKINVMSGNIVSTYTNNEDLFLKVQDLDSKFDTMQKSVDLFLANFTVVEDIPDGVDFEKSDETTVESLVKTVDSVKTFSSLDAIGPEILGNPEIKLRYATRHDTNK